MHKTLCNLRPEGERDGPKLSGRDAPNIWRYEYLIRLEEKKKKKKKKFLQTGFELAYTVLQCAYIHH